MLILSFLKKKAYVTLRVNYMINITGYLKISLTNLKLSTSTWGRCLGLVKG